MLKLTIAAALVAATVAECPNACSGHGECKDKDACACYDGYTAADCSQRVCPFSLAFVDVPAGDLNHDGVTQIASKSKGAAPRKRDVAYSHVQWARYKQAEYWPVKSLVDPLLPAIKYLADGTVDPVGTLGGGWVAAPNEAHWYTECSGKGVCDRESGTCACYDGYNGAACQRTTCPNDCSGHGLCRSVSEIAAAGLNKKFLDSSASANFYAGVQNPFEYRLWDAEKNQACVCDHGYSGVDCSLKECPRGDDPLTTTPSTCGGAACRDEVQNFIIPGANNLNEFSLQFTDVTGAMYKTKTFVIGDVTSATKRTAAAFAIEDALENIPNNATRQVKVSVKEHQFGSPATSNALVSVTFSQLPGDVPSLAVLPNANVMVDADAQIQMFTFPSSIVGETITQVKFFPQNQVGFTPAQFETTSGSPVITVGAGVAGLTTALTTAFDQVSAFKSTFRTNPTVSFQILEDVASTSARFSVYAVFANNAAGTQRFASTGIKVVIDGLTYYGTPLSWNGNKEFSTCSNRGLCDFSTGICSCFAGYTGFACSEQNALAM